jgi:disulfide bond formation protein DsbB
MKALRKYVQYIPYLIFIVSLLATLISLYFSEIMKLVPCVLCWYQRICMYPLIIISAVGILQKDKNFANYALPLSVIGLVISIYHNLLYYKILPESVAPCTQGISCTTKQIEWFGFVTIPLLSMLTFALITACMIIYKKFHK